jgi:hypothetical protein
MDFTKNVDGTAVDDLNFAILETNIRLNRLSNVKSHLRAAGDADGTVEYFRPPAAPSPDRASNRQEINWRDRLRRRSRRRDTDREKRSISL